MDYIKLHCLGNEYLVVCAGTGHHPLAQDWLQGAGGKGLIVLGPGTPGRRCVELYNVRGVRVTPGASALRCAGYVLGTGSWELDTGFGVRRVDVRDQETILWFPPPVLGGEYQIGRDFHGYLVNLIYRYFITFIHDLEDFNLEFQGQALDRYFGGADTVFVQEGEKVRVRLWQRGGESSGSGTAACAAAAVLWRLGKWREPLEISMPGGKVVMAIDLHGNFIQEASVEPVN